MLYTPVMLRKGRIQAKGALRFVEPRFIPWVYTFMRLACPTYLRLAEGIAKVETAGIEHLIGAFQRFYAKQARVMVVFRHASLHDAPVMAYLFCRCLPAAAGRAGAKLGGRAHVHFLYGRGVLNWAGGGASFLFPRIAGIPVMNRKNDALSTRTIRRTLSDGPFPVCLAPEAQVTYHNHRLGPIEGGTARLAVWCLEDLQRQNRNEEILILPVACRYLYRENPERLFARVLERIVEVSGLPYPGTASRYQNLIELTDGLLAKMEAFYARFFTIGKAAGRSASLRDRIERVCRAALRVPETFMRIRPASDLLSRVLTVRQRGWDYLFRSDLQHDGKVSPMDRVLMDRIADEVYLHLRHNELVDVLEYVQPEYIGPEASLNRLIEYALNLNDVVNRLMGGNISTRYSPPGKTVRVGIGEPIEVRKLLPLIPGGRRARADGLMKVVVSRLEHLSAEC
jgi:1-acyl-sn-glycerol-3-phosphate acyltransferase